ncbi:MAG: hypothetical protein V4469_02620 [Patescibacteria group bacterium]
MIISKKQSIEDLVIEILAKKPYTNGSDLVLVINKLRANTTKQAVYKSLGFLLDNEVVAKVDGTYFLSLVWVKRIQKMFGTSTQNTDAVFDLKNGESISYQFPSLLSLDTYWAHITNILIDYVPQNIPVILFDPHYWFVIGRSEVEKDILEVFEKKQKHIFATIGGDTILDKKFRDEYRSKYFGVNIGGKEKFKLEQYLHIFGDFIIEVFIDRKLSLDIEHFYRTRKSITKEDEEIFEKIINKKYKVRMKISRNMRKSGELRKRFSKDFYMPRISDL